MNLEKTMPFLNLLTGKTHQNQVVHTFAEGELKESSWTFFTLSTIETSSTFTLPICLLAVIVECSESRQTGTF